MKLKPLLAVLVALLVGACASMRPMTADRLIALNTEARGGAAAVEHVKAMRIGLEITEPKFTVRGDYVATRSGFMRIDIYAGDERVYTEAIGPKGAWQMGRGKTKGTPSSPEGAKSLERGRIGNLYGLHELPALGYRFALAGREERDGKTSWAVDETTPEGISKRLSFDAETYLVVREVEANALHPDVDATVTRQESHFSDYQPADGVLFSRHMEKIDLDTGQVIQTIVTKSIEVNPDIDPALFVRPQ